MAERKTEYWATGKRKSAVARVRIASGEGALTVNRKSLTEYFGRETVRMIVQQPFEMTQTQGQYDVIVNVRGGGNSAKPRR